MAKTNIILPDSFKKGDKVRIKKNNPNSAPFKNGDIVTIGDQIADAWSVSSHNGRYIYWVESKYFERINTVPLKIKIIPRTKAGKKYYTFQFSKNKRISNHEYNTKPTCKKQLNQFLEDIKTGNYVIE